MGLRVQKNNNDQTIQYLFIAVVVSLALFWSHNTRVHEMNTETQQPQTSPVGSLFFPLPLFCFSFPLFVTVFLWSVCFQQTTKIKNLVTSPKQIEERKWQHWFWTGEHHKHLPILWDRTRKMDCLNFFLRQSSSFKSGLRNKKTRQRQEVTRFEWLVTKQTWTFIGELTIWLAMQQLNTFCFLKKIGELFCDCFLSDCQPLFVFLVFLLNTQGIDWVIRKAWWTNEHGRCAHWKWYCWCCSFQATKNEHSSKLKKQQQSISCLKVTDPGSFQDAIFMPKKLFKAEKMLSGINKRIWCATFITGLRNLIGDFQTRSRVGKTLSSIVSKQG